MAKHIEKELPIGIPIREGGFIYLLHVREGTRNPCNLWDLRVNFYPRDNHKESILAAEFMRRWNEHEKLTRDRDALLAGCKAFVNPPPLTSPKG